MVIASSDPGQLKGSMTLTGSVSATKNVVRVAVTMVEFDSGVVTWSAAFQQPRGEDYASPAELAQQIAAVLPLSFDATQPVSVANATQ